MQKQIVVRGSKSFSYFFDPNQELYPPPRTHLPFTVVESNVARLGEPYRIHSCAQEGYSTNFHSFDGWIRDSSKGRTVHVNISSRNPTNIVSRARVTTLNSHVGTKRQRRMRIWILQIKVVRQSPNFKNPSRTHDISSSNCRVCHGCFRCINFINRLNASCLSIGKARTRQCSHNARKYSGNFHGSNNIDCYNNERTTIYQYSCEPSSFSINNGGCSVG